jgi:hypothetical protein
MKRSDSSKFEYYLEPGTEDLNVLFKTFDEFYSDIEACDFNNLPVDVTSGRWTPDNIKQSTLSFAKILKDSKDFRVIVDECIRLQNDLFR